MPTSHRSNLISAAVALLVCSLLMWAKAAMNDGDTWWHVEAGRVMIADRAVLHTDPFSYTLRGQPWPSHEWLSEIVMAGAFELAGWGGVLALVGLAGGLAVWMFAQELGRRVSGLPFLILLVLCLSLFAPHLLVRPHILVLPILVAWAIELLRAREQDRAPRWIFLPLMTLWANMHGGFAFGLALIGPFALEALITAPAERRMSVVLRWGGFGLAAAAMCVISPHGLDGLLFPLKLTGMWANTRIDEWLPADFSSVSPLMLALLAGVFVVLTRPVKLEPLMAAVVAGLLYASLTHIRHEQLLGLVGGLLLATPLARAYGQSGSVEPAPLRSRQVLASGLVVVALSLACARLAVPVVWTDSTSRPVSALAAVPAEIRARPVLNDYSFGGYLIGNQVAPYVDSRAELYRDDFLKAYARVSDGDPKALDRLLTERRVGWTILKAGSPMAANMDAKSNWRRLYADDWTVVHVPVTP